MRVFITPYFKEPDRGDGGIRRVVEAQRQYLPEFGIEVVDDPAQADVIMGHATSYLEEFRHKPFVHCNHGLYWADHEWQNGLLHANQRIINLATAAKAITVPSRWVQRAFSRGMLKPTSVVYHGVDPEYWTPKENRSDFILWNKARPDIVSNPDEMNALAELMPEAHFVSTLGKAAPNVQLTGVVPFGTMHDMVRSAGVYLATARETFGIGTLEAMACGVPVVGWDHGGQSEIIIQGETGYLVPHGDYQALADATRQALADRVRLGENARADVLARWLWPDKIGQYAEIIRQAGAPHDGPRTSILVTCHNLAKYLPDCLESVVKQTDQDWECLIVDDASTDETPQVAQEFVNRDGRFRYLPTPKNLKLSGARNFGAAQARGLYIYPLDADDMLDERAVEILTGALADDPFTHMAYGHLDIISEDGSGRRRNNWPFDQFSWLGQMAHINQLPYSAMMRREVWECSGGWRDRDWRAEDASFWSRVTGLGFRAKKVTGEATLVYRIRQNSKGATERANGHDDGDWTAWMPWRVGAKTGAEGAEMLGQGKGPHPALVPFGAQGQAPHYCWPVWSHHDPLVSVIIPCGPKHTHLLIDALDSVQAQTFPFWEAIVINDTGGELDLKFAPYARIVEGPGGNIAGARNAGLRASRAPLVVFLDADDLLAPNALWSMIEAYINNGGSRYIYTDWYAVNGKEVELKSAKPYSRQTEKGVTHSITVLMEKAWAESVGYFDETVPGWEDWDFFLKLAVNGYCGERLEKPLFIYRMGTGERREQSLSDKDIMLPILGERYRAYFTGEKAMSGCCGGNGDIVIEAKQQVGLLEKPKEAGAVSNAGLVRIEYVGDNEGSIRIRRVMGQDLSREYKLGRNNLDRYADATPADAKLLVDAGRCRYVKAPGIDLQQATIEPQVISGVPTPPSVPEPVVVKAPVEPAPAPIPAWKSSDDTWEVPADYADWNVQDTRDFLITLNEDQLRKVLKAEEAGKDRKSIKRAIGIMLEDGDRVSAG